MSENKLSSVSHEGAYRSYYSTHLYKYQKLDPSDAISYYRAIFGKVLPPEKDVPILEIGAGLGKFAYYLKKEGYLKLICIDVSEELVRLAREYAGIEVVLVKEPIDFLRVQDKEKYGAVFMLDVIEHIRKDKVIEYLESLKDIIKPGGYLHITTENMASPVGGRIQQYLDFTHEYNYSEISLRQALEIAGFKEINIWELRDCMGRTPKSISYYVMRRIWYALVSLIYEIERPGLVKPKMLGKEIIASAKV